MFYKNFAIFILVILLISTVAAGLKKPPLHNAFAIYNSKYDLIEKDSPAPIEEKIDEKDVVAIKPDVTTEKRDVASQTKNIETKSVNTIQKKSEHKKTNFAENKTVKKIDNVVKSEKEIAPVKVDTQKKGENVKSAQTQVKTERKPEIKNETYISREEEIAWNQWHANLRNKIMSSTNMPPVPDGTIFRYSFTLKKSGEILNLTVRSDNPNYTPYAIQYLAPAIRGLAYSKIVVFPSGSQREKVDITSAFKVKHSSKAVYSSASDFNDSEVVRKGQN